jgi:hypothetical protein
VAVVGRLEGGFPSSDSLSVRPDTSLSSITFGQLVKEGLCRHPGNAGMGRHSGDSIVPYTR